MMALVLVSALYGSELATSSTVLSPTYSVPVMIDEVLPPPGSTAININVSPNGISYLVVTGQGFTASSTVAVEHVEGSYFFDAEVVEWSEDELLVRIVTVDVATQHVRTSNATEHISVTVEFSVPVVAEIDLYEE